jgi:hypothetical protein
MPGSRFELFEQAGHFPHCDEPARFTDLLLTFLASTAPARIDAGEFAARVAEHAAHDAVQTPGMINQNDQLRSAQSAATLRYGQIDCRPVAVARRRAVLREPLSGLRRPRAEDRLHHAVVALAYPEMQERGPDVSS